MDEILNLTNDEQTRLLKDLTAHALHKMRRLTWRGAYVRDGGSVPKGKEPADFALEAIKKALSGERGWNRVAYPTLKAFLRSVVDSEISHLVESTDNRYGRRTSNQGPESFSVPLDHADPRTVVIDRDWKESFQKFALEELEGDEFLQDLFKCLEADITQPAEIAVMLDTTVDRVNNEKKRLNRKLAKLNPRVIPPRKGKRL